MAKPSSRNFQTETVFMSKGITLQQTIHIIN